MRIKGKRIFSPWGLAILHDGKEEKNGCVFYFEDINPSVEFRNVLRKQDRLALAWFFFRSVFITRKVKKP